MSITPAGVLAARPVPVTDDQLDLFATGNDDNPASAECPDPATCTEGSPR